MLATLLFAAQLTDPYMLPIPNTRTVEVQLGKITRTSDGKRVGIPEIVSASEGKYWIYLGETHDNPDAHILQADIVRALVKGERTVVVGMEMYQRSVQSVLFEWSEGKLSEEEFVEKSQWKTQWGFDYSLYKPVFDVIKEKKLPLVGLNVPRDWVRTASREGFDALPEEAKKQLPEMDMSNKDHRKVFDALMGGHPGSSADGFYRGQVLWDEAMADSALRYLLSRVTDDKVLFAVVAGNGHVMYSQGINWRVKKRTGESGITVVPIEMSADSPTRLVTAGLADFVVGVPAVVRN